jgi:5,6,7,8-tetrahydromethanopterin hydro-lyase
MSYVPPPTPIPVQIGEGSEGSGVSVAHVNTILGDRNGPVAGAWASALSTPRDGHAPFVCVARPGMPVKPVTVFVNKAALASEEHAGLTWGAAQAGVAAGIVDSVRDGVIPADQADAAVLITMVWVDPEATAVHQDAIFANNQVATLAALVNGATGRPGAYEMLADSGGFWNPFYKP